MFHDVRSRSQLPVMETYTTGSSRTLRQLPLPGSIRYVLPTSAQSVHSPSSTLTAPLHRFVSPYKLCRTANRGSGHLHRGRSSKIMGVPINCVPVRLPIPFSYKRNGSLDKANGPSNYNEQFNGLSQVAFRPYLKPRGAYGSHNQYQRLHSQAHGSRDCFNGSRVYSNGSRDDINGQRNDNNNGPREYLNVPLEESQLTRHDGHVSRDHSHKCLHSIDGSRDQSHVSRDISHQSRFQCPVMVNSCQSKVSTPTTIHVNSCQSNVSTPNTIHLNKKFFRLTPDKRIVSIRPAKAAGNGNNSRCMSAEEQLWADLLLHKHATAHYDNNTAGCSPSKRSRRESRHRGKRWWRRSNNESERESGSEQNWSESENEDCEDYDCDSNERSHTRKQLETLKDEKLCGQILDNSVTVNSAQKEKVNAVLVSLSELRSIALKTRSFAEDNDGEYEDNKDNGGEDKNSKHAVEKYKDCKENELNVQKDNKLNDQKGEVGKDDADDYDVGKNYEFSSRKDKNADVNAEKNEANDYTSEKSNGDKGKDNDCNSDKDQGAEYDVDGNGHKIKVNKHNDGKDEVDESNVVEESKHVPKITEVNVDGINEHINKTISDTLSKGYGNETETGSKCNKYTNTNKTNSPLRFPSETSTILVKNTKTQQIVKCPETLSNLDEIESLRGCGSTPSPSSSNDNLYSPISITGANSYESMNSMESHDLSPDSGTCGTDDSSYEVYDGLDCDVEPNNVCSCCDTRKQCDANTLCANKSEHSNSVNSDKKENIDTDRVTLSEVRSLAIETYGHATDNDDAENGDKHNLVKDIDDGKGKSDKCDIIYNSHKGDYHKIENMYSYGDEDDDENDKDDNCNSNSNSELWFIALETRDCAEEKDKKDKKYECKAEKDSGEKSDKDEHEHDHNSEIYPYDCCNQYDIRNDVMSYLSDVDVLNNTHRCHGFSECKKETESKCSITNELESINDAALIEETCASRTNNFEDISYQTSIREFKKYESKTDNESQFEELKDWEHYFCNVSSNSSVTDNQVLSKDNIEIENDSEVRKMESISEENVDTNKILSFQTESVINERNKKFLRDLKIKSEDNDERTTNTSVLFVTDSSSSMGADLQECQSINLIDDVASKESEIKADSSDSERLKRNDECFKLSNLLNISILEGNEMSAKKCNLIERILAECLENSETSDVLTSPSDHASLVSLDASSKSFCTMNDSLLNNSTGNSTERSVELLNSAVLLPKTSTPKDSSKNASLVEKKDEDEDESLGFISIMDSGDGQNDDDDDCGDDYDVDNDGNDGALVTDLSDKDASADDVDANLSLRVQIDSDSAPRSIDSDDSPNSALMSPDILPIQEPIDDEYISDVTSMILLQKAIGKDVIKPSNVNPEREQNKEEDVNNPEIDILLDEIFDIVAVNNPGLNFEDFKDNLDSDQVTTDLADSIATKLSVNVQTVGNCNSQDLDDHHQLFCFSPITVPAVIKGQGSDRAHTEEYCELDAMTGRVSSKTEHTCPIPDQPNSIFKTEVSSQALNSSLVDCFNKNILVLNSALPGESSQTERLDSNSPIEGTEITAKSEVTESGTETSLFRLVNSVNNETMMEDATVPSSWGNLTWARGWILNDNSSNKYLWNNNDCSQVNSGNYCDSNGSYHSNLDEKSADTDTLLLALDNMIDETEEMVASVRNIDADTTNETATARKSLNLSENTGKIAQLHIGEKQHTICYKNKLFVCKINRKVSTKPYRDNYLLTKSCRKPTPYIDMILASPTFATTVNVITDKNESQSQSDVGRSPQKRKNEVDTDESRRNKPSPVKIKRI